MIHLRLHGLHYEQGIAPRSFIQLLELRRVQRALRHLSRQLGSLLRTQGGERNLINLSGVTQLASLCRYAVTRFPDSELHVELHDSVRARDLYVVQPTGPPVDGHLMELLLLADAGRRAGAARLTAVVPYFGYARQDRRARGAKRSPADSSQTCSRSRAFSEW